MPSRRQYWYGYVAQLISFTALLLFNTIIPRVIGLEMFAALSVGYALVYFGILLLDEGFNIELILTKQRQWTAIITLKMVCCIAVFCTINLALHWILSYLNVKSIYLWPLQIFTLNMIFVPFISAVSSYFVAINKNQLIILINMASGFIITTIPLGLALATANPFAIINSVTLSYFFVAILCAALFIKHKKESVESDIPWANMIFKSIDQSAGSITNVFFSWGIFILLAKYYGNDVAVYNKIAYSICNALCYLLPIAMLNLYQLTSLGDAISDIHYRKIFLIVTPLAVIFSLILYAFGAKAIGVLLGGNFAESMRYIQYLSFVVMLKAVTDILRPVVLKKFGHVYLLISGILSMASVALFLWLNREFHFASAGYLYYSAYVVLLLLFTFPLFMEKVRERYGTA